MNLKLNIGLFLLLLLVYACNMSPNQTSPSISDLRQSFKNPPDSVRPGVYWYFMDGNMSKEGMTSDLESMKKVGIGNVIFLEVNVGVPQGSVDFLSDQWLKLFNHAVGECTRLGISMTLGIGPGWTGSGGPWVRGNQSMQHLVASSLNVTGPGEQAIKLTGPAPQRPFFGEGVFTPALRKKWDAYYKDVAVLAFPTPSITPKIEDIDEKALYERAPYSSVAGVKPYLPSLPVYANLPDRAVIDKDNIIDLTDQLHDGVLKWDVPAGNWTIMRLGSRNNGAVTRPAPLLGLGFECDKFDTTALNAHLENYIGKLLHNSGDLDPKRSGGLKMLHMDSWEMGAQNWTSGFREEFRRRRGYDPLPFYPVYLGNVVESLEISERFLWDLRLTCQELVLDYHAQQVKKYAHKHGLGLSIEPYDMNPTADLELGSVADVPMCEFWSKGYGLNSTYSCMEATSIAHVNGDAVVAAEAFTADHDAWRQYPGSMKNQGDWAFACGINRLVYHTFQHQSLNDSLKPGMTMGPYGVHWDRNQTWWSMAGSYHRYISRCQSILQQGRTVADILYLTPEGAPHIFRPPSSALTADELLPDRKEYNFDGCSPGQLSRAIVKDHQIVFPGGASYRLLILPLVRTMTPALLEKIRSLVTHGATVIGIPPLKSPGLTGYPGCDTTVKSLAEKLWGEQANSTQQTERNNGKGKILWGGDLSINKADELYPSYESIARVLRETGVAADFKSALPIRYTHRTTPGWDIYFVSNRTGGAINGDCIFRTTKGSPELWDPLTGETRKLPQFENLNGCTTISLKFDAFQSYFIVFSKGTSGVSFSKTNFPEIVNIAPLVGSWELAFDPQWGGPERICFDSLEDWTLRPEEGIKYYSGTAIYKKQFDFPEARHRNDRFYLDLGEVRDMARVRLNGQNLGVVWTAPWRVDLTKALKQKDNALEIEVANLWVNRLIGDEHLPDDGVRNGQWPAWLVNDEKRTSGRYTFTTYRFYNQDSPLLKSGLIGPVVIQKEFMSTKIVP